MKTTPHLLSFNERRILSVTARLKLATKTVHEADIIIRQIRTTHPEYIPATEGLKANTSKSLLSLLRAIDGAGAVKGVMS